MIQACNIDARISIDRMELIFGIEELIFEGIISIEEGDEIIKEAIVIIISEQLLHKMRKEKLEEA